MVSSTEPGHNPVHHAALWDFLLFLLDCFRMVSGSDIISRSYLELILLVLPHNSVPFSLEVRHPPKSSFAGSRSTIKL